MKIGIIGTGNIGGTLAAKFAAAGHTVKLAGSKGPDAIRGQADKINAIPVTAEEAVKGVEVVILSIPFAQIPDVAKLFAGVPPDVAVLDTSNYYPLRDSNILEVDEGKPESVWASEQLGRPVIKAFNALLAQTLAEKGRAPNSAGRIAIPVAGDDKRAKSLAFEFVDAAGFDSLDAGDLATSWRQQPGTPAYCTELSVNELSRALASADQSRSAEARDRIMAKLMTADGPPDHEQIVSLNRALSATR